MNVLEEYYEIYKHIKNIPNEILSDKLTFISNRLHDLINQYNLPSSTTYTYKLELHT